jgi:hypothetical protein
VREHLAVLSLPPEREIEIVEEWRFIWKPLMKVSLP